MTACIATARGERIAYRHHRAGGACTVVFLPGFHSDMNGEKATAIQAWAERKGCDCLRFDYRGHGESSGRIEDYVLSDWLDDACLLLEKRVEGRCVLVGSSMGAWLALHVAERHPEAVDGIITLAAATDFTGGLISTGASPAQLESLAEHGHFVVDSGYGDGPYTITMRLIEDGQSLLMLQRTIAVTCPVYLDHGLEDRDVPPVVSQRTFEALASEEAELTLVKNGDHRLSRTADLRRLCSQLERLVYRR
jgi:pimeloyl-ACP methyl ester carboxylesterase